MRDSQDTISLRQNPDVDSPLRPIPILGGRVPVKLATSFEEDGGIVEEQLKSGLSRSGGHILEPSGPRRTVQRPMLSPLSPGSIPPLG